VSAMRDLCGFPLYSSSADWTTVQGELEALELGDGLPLVIPTAARLDAMLAGVTAPQHVHALLPPLAGELRIDTLAYQCVLAGCQPAELPVVFSAVKACLHADFNLLGILTTTGTATVAVVVHGAIAATLGVSSTTNCLGPGARANACIGRAVSLVLRNIAGAKQGVGDMATMGQPGKFSFCFAESESANFPSLLERQGFDAEQSAVTVLGVSGTAEVLPIAGGVTPQQILAPVALAMGASVLMCGAREREPTQQVVLLPPELVQQLAAHGFGLTEIQSYLYESADVYALLKASQLSGVQAVSSTVAASAVDIHPLQTGGPGVKMTVLPLWSGGTRPQTRLIDDLSVG
jgi:hypothetical protein